jgi:2,4-dienoyl-CoA reductase-like NADH-dependent reductase (Old Yellow Enzyme family)
VDAAAAVKAAVIAAGCAVPVAGVGGITEPAFAERLVRAGTIDAVCVGRAQLTDPEWARKALAALGDSAALSPKEERPR